MCEKFCKYCQTISTIGLLIIGGGIIEIRFLQYKIVLLVTCPLQLQTVLCLSIMHKQQLPLIMSSYKLQVYIIHTLSELATQAHWYLYVLTHNNNQIASLQLL